MWKDTGVANIYVYATICICDYMTIYIYILMYIFQLSIFFYVYFNENIVIESVFRSKLIILD